mmetsp:Transcript_5638/g.23129  ORF Transcript_5638/g.23129 Transcript_5638/m.23129 type:complete len:219 (-) Transcript_5638:733-1389(-)
MDNRRSKLYCSDAPNRGGCLIHVRDQPVLDDGAVLVPVLPVLLLARLAVPHVPVHEQDAEVDDVKVWHHVRKPAREAPGPRHEPVAQVVDVPRDAPPPAGDKPGAPLRGQVRQVRHPRVVRVVAEPVLLEVAPAEDGVPESLDAEDERQKLRGQRHGTLQDVPRLQRVRERHPHEVAEHQHEPEPVGGDVHGGQDGGLEPEGIRHVERLKRAHEAHGG